MLPMSEVDDLSSIDGMKVTGVSNQNNIVVFGKEGCQLFNS